jgi:cyclase
VVMKKVRKAYDKNTIYIFGHAADGYPVFGTASDLKAMENYLKSLRKYVKKEKKKGVSLDQLKEKTTIIPGAPEWNAGERLLGVNLEVMWAEI